MNTKKKIEEYVFNQYFNGNFNKITVSQISADLGISRSTFYYNFSSVSDVVEEVKIKFSFFHKSKFLKDGKYSKSQIVTMLEKVKENKYFFLCYIKYVLFNTGDNVFSLEISPKVKEYESAASASIVLVWLLNGCDIEPCEIADKIIKIFEECNDEI